MKSDTPRAALLGFSELFLLLLFITALMYGTATLPAPL